MDERREQVEGMKKARRVKGRSIGKCEFASIELPGRLADPGEDRVEVKNGAWGEHDFAVNPLERDVNVEKERVRLLLNTADRLFPGVLTPAGEIRAEDLARRAYNRADMDLGVEAAVEAAEGFVIPRESVERDVKELYDLCGGDFEKLTAHRKEKLKDVRLSTLRVKRALSENNPESEKLERLARSGMPGAALMPEVFIPNGSCRELHPKLRKGYLRAAPAVNKCLYKNFYDKGLAILLPIKEVMKIKGSNIIAAGWAPKNGVPIGRPTGDPISMNTEFTKLKTDELWGEVKHPTIDDFVKLIWAFWEENNQDGAWSDVVMWKMDIKGAYTQLWYETKDAKLFFTQLTEDIAMATLCGFFGWTGTPGGFDPVTRAVRWEMKQRLKGKGNIYVDDTFGCCFRWQVKHDMGVVKEVIEELLGPRAIADEKSVAEARRIDIIGYDIDLNEQLVTINDRGLERAFYAFMSVDMRDMIEVRQMQRLASYSTRLTTVCPQFATFSRCLYQSYIGAAQNAKIHVSMETRRAIQVARALISLMTAEENSMARPLGWWKPSQGCEVMVVEFDASLTGIGVLFFQRAKNGTEYQVGRAALDIRCLGFKGKPQFQNCAEFIAAVAGMRGVQMLRSRDASLPRRIHMRGDSTAALHWVATNRFGSNQVLNAASVCILLSAEAELEIINVEHIAGEDNGRADYLSRLFDDNRGADEAGGNKEKTPAPMVDLKMEELLRCCDPRVKCETEEEFTEFWGNIRREIRRAVHNPTQPRAGK